MKIANKISLSFVVAATVLVIPAAFLSNSISEKNTIKSSYSLLNTTLHSRENHINTYLEMLKGRMIDFSSDGKIKDCLSDIKKDIGSGCTSEELSKHLITNKIVAIEDLYEVEVLDADGKVVGTTNPEEKKGIDFSKEIFFTEGKQRASIEGVFFDTEFDRFGLTVTAPVHRQTGGKEVLGVVVGKLSPESLNRILLERNGLGETGEIYLVNGDGFLITPSRFYTNIVLEKKIDTFGTQNCKVVKEGGLEQIDIYDDYRSRSVVGTHMFISEMDWCLIAEMGEKEILQPLITLQNIFIIVAALSFFAALLIGFIIAKLITQSLRILSEGAKKIGEGDLNHKIVVKDGDEISELSDIFNKMSSKLSKLYSSQKELNEFLKIVNKILRHDILNNLTSASGNISLYLEYGDKKVDVKDTLKNVDESMQRGIKFIQSMKDLETAFTEDDGKILEKCSVLNKTRELAESFKEIEINITGDVMIMSDGACETVLKNLFRNAVVHGKASKIDVIITEDKNAAIVRVADNGKGISDEIKNKLFVEGAKFGETGNTGLGLYVIRKTVEKFGGTVSVEDNSLNGAVFVIKIPKKQ